MNLLIRSVHIFDPGSPFHQTIKDLLVADGRISAITDHSEKIPEGSTVISGEGLCVSPGWFDLHVHFSEPGFEFREDLQSGMAAAAQGGFTGVLCMPTTQPPIHSKSEVEFILKRTAGQLVEVHPAGCITVNREGKELAELYDMWLSGAKAFTDDQHPLRNAGVLVRALTYCKDFGGRLMVYAEDKDLSAKGQMNEGPSSTLLGLKGMPALAESVMIARDLQVLAYSGGALHFSTVSTAEGVALIRAAKKQGLNVTADVAAYHLLLDDSVLSEFDTNYKVKPPIRSNIDRNELIAGLQDGTLDAITTDHRPLDIEAKQKEYDLADFGMVGLETGFGVLNTALKDKISLERIIDAIAIQPRRILGLTTPTIREGSTANLTVFSPNESWTVTRSALKSRSANSPFIGQTLTGRPVAVINGNRYAIL